MNAFANIVDAMHMIKAYAAECHDENLRRFADAIICGNDAGKSAEFWLKDLPDVEAYYKQHGIPFPIHKAKKQRKRVCISNPPMTRVKANE